MQVKMTNSSKTEVVLTVVAEQKELVPIKAHVLTHFQKSVKVPGFRAGKIPAEILEKNIEPSVLQTQFLEEAVEQLYIAAAQDNKLRPVDRPQIEIKKFVPFTTLEFEARVSVIGEITLPDYTKIKLAKPNVKIGDKEVDEVLTNLQVRLAEKQDVNRAAKDGDQVWIDFTGIDAKTKDTIKGADGKDYPLVIGSNTFIPGFEPELIDMSAGDEKTFTVMFPKDYGAKEMAGRKVTFTVVATKVQEIVTPELDDEFAAKAGPFKTLADLKKDITEQLGKERQHQADREYESELVKKISDNSKLEVPDVLIDDQVERLWHDLKQNVVYRGQTIQEFLKSEDETEESYKTDVLKPQAAERVKASLVLSEIAEKEKLDVTPEELEIRMQILQAQYQQDAQMQEELAKPEARRDIASRLLTEKTLQKIVGYVTK